MSTKKIQITTPIVTSVNGKTGDVTLDVSGSGGGTSVQADWNQNDSSASDYIKNRPFYTINADSITWDGSVEERPNVGEIYYLISEQDATGAYFVGATVIITMISTASGEIQNQEPYIIVSCKTVETMNNSISTNNVWLFYTTDKNQIPICYVSEDNTIYSGATFPKKGLYSILAKDKTAGTTTYVSSVVPSSASVKYKTLDPNYLPVATTTSIGAVKAGNGLSISEDGTLSVTTATYYSGTSTPANTLGADGDLYLQTEG